MLEEKNRDSLGLVMQQLTLSLLVFYYMFIVPAEVNFWMIEAGRGLRVQRLRNIIAIDIFSLKALGFMAALTIIIDWRRGLLAGLGVATLVVPLFYHLVIAGLSG